LAFTAHEQEQRRTVAEGLIVGRCGVRGTDNVPGTRRLPRRQIVEIHAYQPLGKDRAHAGTNCRRVVWVRRGSHQQDAGPGDLTKDVGGRAGGTDALNAITPDTARRPEAEALSALEPGGDVLDRLPTMTDDAGPTITVLSQTTAGELCRSARWRELYHPHGVADELRLSLFADGHCWGYLELLRDRTGGYFTTEESEFLLRLGAPMARALRAALTYVSAPTTDIPHGPGTLVIDAHDAIQATTPDGDQWVTLLRSYASPAEALFSAPVPGL